MTRHDAVTVAELVSAWAKTLADEIDRLDSELPIEHETGVRYQLKMPGIYILKTPETHPELYDEYTVTLPLAELNNLRELVARMLSLCDGLTSEIKEIE